MRFSVTRPVVVQKSLEEGFGLTVAEAMWKAHPVLASAVGGIVDQVAPGTGVLLRDPSDLDTFGRVLAELLANPVQMTAMGRRARVRIRSISSAIAISSTLRGSSRQ